MLTRDHTASSTLQMCNYLSAALESASSTLCSTSRSLHRLIYNNRSTIVLLALVGLVNVAAAEIMALSPQNDETTLACFQTEKYGNTGFIVHHIPGNTGFGSHIVAIGRMLNCQLPEKATVTQIVECLNSGIGLFAFMPGKQEEAFQFVAKANEEACGASFAKR